MLDVLLTLFIHSAGDYHGIAPVTPVAASVVCGSSTVPVIDELSDTVVCEAPQQVLAAPALYAPISVGYQYGGVLSPWAGTFNFGGLGGRFGSHFGGHFGGHSGGHRCTSTITGGVTTRTCN
jgi:hypothetical protein